MIRWISLLVGGWFAVAAGLPPAVPNAYGSDTESAMHVQLRKEGDAVLVDVNFFVAATPVEAWEVLTDFDHMHHFVSSVSASRVVQREGNRLQVAQSGKASAGLLAFAFESLRDVQLAPYHTIRTRQLSGSMKRFEGLTSLQAEGAGTRVTFHSESVPGGWMPPLLGESFIEHQVQQQYQEIRAEILKRKAAPGLALRAPRNSATLVHHVQPRHGQL
jgi:carbon monoxide dehydrogenase subunit G